MDNMNFGREKDFPLGLVARSIPQEDNLCFLMDDRLFFDWQITRIPSGPAIVLPSAPQTARCVEEYQHAERWDGLS